MLPDTVFHRYDQINAAVFVTGMCASGGCTHNLIQPLFIILTLSCRIKLGTKNNEMTHTEL